MATRMAVAEVLEDCPGVVKVLAEENRGYYTCEDVMQLYGVRKTKAYEIIAYLQEEAIREGKLAPCIPAGRIPKEIFRKRMGLG